MITFSAHQPDFFPYSGFWYKVMKSDIFDISLYDQFNPRVHQRRVGIGKDNHWWTVPVDYTFPCNIADVKLPIGISWRHDMYEEIAKEYRHTKNWSKVSKIVAEVLFSNFETLSDMNVSAINFVKDYLDIKTPMAISYKPVGKGSDNVLELCKLYKANKYISGNNGVKYLDIDSFKKEGIEIEYTKHKIEYQQSILHLLFNFDKKQVIDLILKENENTITT